MYITARLLSHELVADNDDGSTVTHYEKWRVTFCFQKYDALTELRAATEQVREKLRTCKETSVIDWNGAELFVDDWYLSGPTGALAGHLGERGAVVINYAVVDGVSCAKAIAA